MSHRRCLAIIATVSGAFFAPGCQGTGGPGRDLTVSEVATLPTEPDIVKVVASFNRYTSWMWTEDRSRVQGAFIPAVYLIGPDGKGVFGDGTLRPKLYVIQKNAGGAKKPVLEKEWNLTVEEAVPWRSKKPKYPFGWGYALPLIWGEQDLGGREVRIVIGFQRSDGREISSTKLDAIVPRGG